MSAGWLRVAALLAALLQPQAAATGRGALSVAPARRVKGHPEAQLALTCGDGDGDAAGVVQYWHTPFGELHSHSVQSELDPVFMRRDGRLLIRDSSVLHSGLYYCLLRHTEGTTLWPYELHVCHDRQRNQDEPELGSGCAAVRLGRDAEAEQQAQVSDEAFAGAVAASVLLTFALGFSTGALSRTQVLRCLGVLAKRLRLSQQQTDVVDSGSHVTMPPMSRGSEMRQAQEVDAGNWTNTDATASSAGSPPPTKPQRSFRHKREEQQEMVAYLEGHDYKKEQERKMEEEKKMCDEEEREYQTDDKKCSEDREEQDGGQGREEKEDRQEEEADVHDNESKDEGEQSRASEEERKEEGWRDKNEGEGGEGDIYRDSQSSTEMEGNETDGRRREDTEKNGIMGADEAPALLPCPARRSRVIRLYQYDEDGQRYCHLPDATPEDPGPVPRPRQRTRSLTRLSAIMAAASAGPLDRQETGGEEKEERAHFHMDV